MIGVEDEEYGQRVAAIATLAKNHEHGLNIYDLRDDLRRILPAYKLPTLLRILGGELPKGETGKVQKRVLGPQLFPVPGWQKEKAIQIWDRKKDRASARM